MLRNQHLAILQAEQDKQIIVIKLVSANQKYIVILLVADEFGVLYLSFIYGNVLARNSKINIQVGSPVSKKVKVPITGMNIFLYVAEFLATAVGVSLMFIL